MKTTLHQVRRNLITMIEDTTGQPYTNFNINGIIADTYTRDPYAGYVLNRTTTENDDFWDVVASHMGAIA